MWIQTSVLITITFSELLLRSKKHEFRPGAKPGGRCQRLHWADQQTSELQFVGEFPRKRLTKDDMKVKRLTKDDMKIKRLTKHNVKVKRLTKDNYSDCLGQL